MVPLIFACGERTWPGAAQERKAPAQVLGGGPEHRWRDELQTSLRETPAQMWERRRKDTNKFADGRETRGVTSC